MTILPRLLKDMNILHEDITDFTFKILQIVKAIETLNSEVPFYTINFRQHKAKRLSLF